MWLFSKKNTANRIDDKVWITNSKKNNGLITDAKNYIENGKLVLISYFFQNTYELISQILEKENTLPAGRLVDYEKILAAGSVSQLKINFVAANLFHSQSFIDKLSFDSHEIIILFAEHYPLFKTEKETLGMLNPLGKNTSYGFYVSLDEKLMEIFGGDRIKILLTKLGLTEDEFISHLMVTNAIENAQKKIETKVSSEMKTNSMEEWFSKNFRSS